MQWLMSFIQGRFLKLMTWNQWRLLRNGKKKYEAVITTAKRGGKVVIGWMDNAKQRWNQNGKKYIGE